jgi:hypothetical protein
MNIDFLRTGGFAGLRLSLAVNTDDLPEEEASRLNELLESASLAGRPAPVSENTPARDRFEYRLTIARGARQQASFVWPENDVPVEVWPLLEYLTELATRQSRPGQAGDPPPT